MQSNSGKFILVIDDSADSQILLKTLLELKGHHVYTALNGMEALSILKELSSLPDLILLDAQMPVMDGYQFRIEQDKDDRLKSIPVVIMSGDTDIDMDEKMIHPEGILMKPLNVKSVMDSISHFF